jgi:hypothetical protein
MDNSFIEEYLIAIGAKTDSQSFEDAKRKTSDLESHLKKIEKNTAFTALLQGVEAFIKAANFAVGVIKKLGNTLYENVVGVARADMQYMKLARSMWVTKETAKSLQMAMDEMGASMEDIAWIPELRDQFFRLREAEPRGNCQVLPLEVLKDRHVLDHQDPADGIRPAVCAGEHPHLIFASGLRDHVLDRKSHDVLLCDAFVMFAGKLSTLCGHLNTAELQMPDNCAAGTKNSKTFGPVARGISLSIGYYIVRRYKKQRQLPDNKLESERWEAERYVDLCE